MVEVVRKDVHGEGRHGDVALPTDMALFGIARVQTPMGLLVARQIGAGGIVLSAFRTNVLIPLSASCCCCCYSRCAIAASLLALLGSAVND